MAISLYVKVIPARTILRLGMLKSLIRYGTKSRLWITIFGGLPLDMGCKCNDHRRQEINEKKVVFGEKGLEQVFSMNRRDAIGFVTGYRYPFSIRDKMFVDARDAVYLLGQDY